VQQTIETSHAKHLKELRLASCLQLVRLSRNTLDAINATTMPACKTDAAVRRLDAALKPMFGGQLSDRGMLHAKKFPDMLDKILAALPAAADNNTKLQVGLAKYPFAAVHTCLLPLPFGQHPSASTSLGQSLLLE